MRDDTPSSNGLRPSAPSRNASARISRELDNWRQSLALSTAGTEFELDDEDDEEDAEANDIRRSFGPDWSTLTSGKTNKPVKEKEKKKPPEPEDAYSTQELDNILKSAKDQLEVGNSSILRKARANVETAAGDQSQRSPTFTSRHALPCFVLSHLRLTLFS